MGDSDLCFDHGAQYFTARDSAFRALVDRLVAAGAVARYPNSVTGITDTARTHFPDEPRFVGTPGMNAMSKALANGLDVETSRHISELIRDANGWTLALSDGLQTGPFESVVIAVPAEQAAELLSPVAPSLAREAQAARTSPCWAAMLVFPSRVKADFEAARVGGSSALGWAAQMKGNDEAYSCWVLHAKPDWSRDNIAQSPQWISDELARAFSEFARIDENPLHAAAHRWRYAQVQAPAGTPFAWDDGLGLGVCGDWRLGPRVELAWQSGDALGCAIAGSA
jgi:predicted NAD/FAD-dependent oxidoreductase